MFIAQNAMTNFVGIEINKESYNVVDIIIMLVTFRYGDAAITKSLLDSLYTLNIVYKIRIPNYNDINVND